jgi:hypothetical protein
MAFRQTQLSCKDCERKTLHQKEILSGSMGCLLTVVTAGIFLPFWLLSDLLGMAKPWICQSCGRSRR